MKLNITADKAQPDPYVIKEGGTYFMYVTDYKGVSLYVSSNKIDWEYKGLCFSAEGYKEYWAPSVIKIGNEFFMYVSNMKEEEKDVHLQAMVVAKSSSPYGPFTKANDLIKPFSIDSHVVENKSGLYIFYSTNDYDAVRAGTLIMVDKMKSPYEVEGDPKVVVRATLDQEIFMRDRFKKGQHWHTLEGAFYLRKGNYHYVIYSGNCYQNENYYLGYAVACGDTDDLKSLEFKKYPDENTYLPLISKNEVESGTGHCSVLEEDGKYYVFYHGRDNDSNKKGECRTARIAEIKVEEEKISLIKR
ncbi:MAG: glycoside hydrolase family 43 protein [Bacilli bacterium]|nr:glycoside hydrolase family 43 protein [Bacilli bacterium]